MKKITLFVTIIIATTQIMSLVSQPDFERYDRLLLQNTLDVMPDVEYCPRIRCQKPVVVEEDDDMGYCQACDFAFCTKCKSTYHGTDLCKWEKDLLALEVKKKEANKKWNYKRLPFGTLGLIHFFSGAVFKKCASSERVSFSLHFKILAFSNHFKVISHVKLCSPLAP